eukprot:TRINITY_DN12450_c0_g1_i2.p1 TRINITY_DN12450_c0_g1~~TRINITY_DN12450_c0_g1_i2.p1  ORF type:complete len:353 (-),score=116.45 TRINITY_DN12450_c0_g1_i2:111-1169(-)
MSETTPEIKQEKEQLNRKNLVRFLQMSLEILPAHYASQELNRLTIVYFIVAAHDVTNELDKIKNKKEIIDFIYSLQILPDSNDPEKNRGNCGFRGSPYIGNNWNPECEPVESLKHDYSHIANTYVALALLKILGDDFGRINREAILTSLLEMQLEDGSYSSQVIGSESDMRFVYCASAICGMLKDFSGMNVDKAVEYIKNSQSFDGVFAQGFEQEGHGGSSYCALASLKLMNRLDEIDNKEQIVDWLTSRQISGFQGRINKVADSCYSWWVGASLNLLDSFHLINESCSMAFTFSCQSNYGGFSKVPDVHPDVLHTYYSLCGLSMAGYKGLQEIDYTLGITKRAASEPTVFD